VPSLQLTENVRQQCHDSRVRLPGVPRRQDLLQDMQGVSKIGRTVAPSGARKICRIRVRRLRLLVRLLTCLVLLLLLLLMLELQLFCQLLRDRRPFRGA